MIAPPRAAWPSRAVARSTRAMVASPHPLATAAGVDVLRRGGNAVDAAIAANAVLTVVYPASCGIGGDAFWIVHDPKTGATHAYNGSGRTPRAASLERLPGGTVPQRGALTVTVPGAVRSWEDVLRAHGSRGLDDLLAEAERVAREGFAVTDVVAAYARTNEALLRDDAEATRIYLTSGPPRPGDILRNPDLADTLAAIRRGGSDAFYTGRTAERIVATLRARGNLMTLDDLAGHRTQAATPLRIPWRGGALLAHPPNSQAACMLLAMGMLEHDAHADEPLWNHLAIEAMKRAIAIRDATFADPDIAPSGIDAELTAERLRALRAEIDPERAQPKVSREDHGDTIALCAVDEDGGAVSLIESLYMNFGSGIVAEGTGVVLHNRGAYFSTEPGHPNVYAGGKRPMHTLSPAMYLRDERPEIVFGSMGGDGQPQILVQFLHHLVERGLNVQQALDMPRWIYGRASIPERPDVSGSEALIVESRMSEEIVAGLERRGHRVALLGPYENAMGHAHGIAIDRDRGTLAGGADPRADSLALGL
ncbi:putative gamma-glutamyltransferase YwrD [Vulcanimicrobium alpinum]|uniref:Gamma-glutamyltransferase YwrD n=1 Tax=Vulcanimicrobium alpinum TaxID=3016050 RepID=A0AAN1XU83_UNVUL|nr:gamma-glutamyltransferase family protein [Vulcanimicrobium alpinum]BDE05599.1 putative gamma-glutamyltransferase YwrD [Vulcanimicrobium alpinum]